MCEKVDETFEIAGYPSKHTMIYDFFAFTTEIFFYIYLCVKDDRHDAVIANAALLFFSQT